VLDLLMVDGEVVQKCDGFGDVVFQLNWNPFLWLCPHQPILFIHSNFIWWGLQSMKLIATKFSLCSCYFFSPQSEYPPQHSDRLDSPAILTVSQSFLIQYRNQTKKEYFSSWFTMYSQF
jgi:hypothetical protein